jgi:hypothetical protein
MAGMPPLVNPRLSPLGFDAYVGPQPDGSVDLCPDGRSCGDVELVRNAIVARSMCESLVLTGAPGDVIPFGVDVRSWVGEAGDDDTAAGHQQELVIVYARDPRIDTGSIVVTITATPTNPEVDFTIAVSCRTTTQRPIALVMNVSAVTVDLLAQGGGGS